MRRVETLEYEVESPRKEPFVVTLAGLSAAVRRAEKDLGEAAGAAKAYLRAPVSERFAHIEGAALVVTVVEDVETGA